MYWIPKEGQGFVPLGTATQHLLVAGKTRL